MQNVYPFRELYNPNPCRDMWDSEHLSQAAASCSQGSQNSSSDLFSQSRMSQLKGFNSIDVWSQPSNSQQLPEDEPVKYYMKYMTKPPLFSSESELQSQRKQKPQTTSYKELIEIQKKKTAERDDRDVLDSFISLLKDYTKEVKSAMDSFKDSIDTTLSTKAEMVATAASQSADLIKKLKDDLLDGFAYLRKDLKENEELKEIISKQNEKIIEQESKIKILQSQLDDCRAREGKSIEKHEKYMEREDKLMRKLEEINNKQGPLPTNLPSSERNFTYNQLSGRFQDLNEVLCPQRSSIMPYQPKLAWDSAELPRYARLHHMYSQTQSVPHPFVQNTSEDVINTNEQGTTYTEAIPALNYHSRPQPAQDEAVVPCVNIPLYPANTALASNQNVIHPTATIAPMRPFSDEVQQLPCKGDRNIVEYGNQTASRPPKEVMFVPDHETHLREAGGRAFTSPVARVPSLVKATRPKQSPIAAVHPLIRVKSECGAEINRADGPSCAKQFRKEADPFDIFVFDLTSSSEEEGCEVLVSKPSSLKPAPKCSVSNPHITRSKTKTGVNNTNKQKSTKSFTEANDFVSYQRSKVKTNEVVPKKLSSVEENISSLEEKVISPSKCKESKGYRFSISTPNRPVKASLDNGIPRSKVAQSVFQKSKTSFKRNVVAAKRKLSFDASELFDGLEDDANIQEITERIRKHAQRKRAAKVL